jgi:hypothetical protein
MLRKLVSVIVAVALLAQAPLAAATDLSSAFSTLLTNGSAAAVNKPGHYQSAARNSFVAGGLEMRVPRNQGVDAQLFSFTPPRVSAGCNGVSAYFGGFSFISGAEFDQLVKNIASGAALGFVTMLVMKGLCPQCEDIVTKLKNAAQAASRLSIDSCKLGQEAAAKFSGYASDHSTELCGTTTADAGSSSDFLSSVSDTCTSVANNLKAMQNVNPQTQGDSAQAKAANGALLCANGKGNLTWQALGAFNEGFSGSTGSDAYSRKLMLMNMMGAVLTTGTEEASCANPDGSVTATAADTTHNQVFCPPTVTAKDMAGAFMCGTDKTALSAMGPAAQQYCQSFFTAAPTADGVASFAGVEGAKVLACDDKQTCLHLSLVNLSDSGIATGAGFLPQVNKILNDAVSAVQRNQAMSSDAIALMQAAPYPLYQAVNAAAVYPVAASDLLDSISILVAESVTANYMEEFVRQAGRDSATSCTNQDQMHRIIDTLASAKAENKARRELMAQNIAVQQGLKEQIRSINLAIQQQVMSNELLNQNHMAETLTRAVSTTNSGTDPGTGAGTTGTVSTQP